MSTLTLKKGWLLDDFPSLARIIDYDDLHNFIDNLDTPDLFDILKIWHYEIIELFGRYAFDLGKWEWTPEQHFFLISCGMGYLYPYSKLEQFRDDLYSNDYVEYKDGVFQFIHFSRLNTSYPFSSEIYQFFQKIPYHLLKIDQPLPYSLQEILLDNSGKHSRPSISPAIGNIFSHFDVIFRYI